MSHYTKSFDNGYFGIFTTGIAPDFRKLLIDTYFTLSNAALKLLTMLNIERWFCYLTIPGEG